MLLIILFSLIVNLHYCHAHDFIWDEVTNGGQDLIDHDIEQSTLYIKTTSPAPSTMWFHTTKNGVIVAGIEIRIWIQTPGYMEIGFCTGHVPLPATDSYTNETVWALRKTTTAMKVWRDEVLIYSYDFADTQATPDCESRWSDVTTDGIKFNTESSPGIYIGTVVRTIDGR